MGGNGKYYNVEAYEAWKKSRGNAYIPPRANFLAAVHYIRNLLDGKKFTWAAVGGLAMLCLGARREMHDIHIVYSDQDFLRLKTKLESDQRSRLPTGMNTLFTSKLLVSTGPQYKDPGCTENIEVEVNLLPPGAHGAPTTNILRANMVLLSLKSEGKSTGVKGLNLLYLVNTLLAFYKIRELPWDPRRDVLFLCQHYGRDIESVRGQLVQRDVQENFLGTPFFSKLTPEDQRLCYQVLLGKEPPPQMSLTPAPPQLSSSAPESARPRIPSHKSSPSLNTAVDQHSAFLVPPKPSKPKSNRPKTAGAAAPPSQTHGPAPTPAHVPGKPQLHSGPAPAAAARDSRSRYRPVNNSAPNTPSGSRNVSPEAPAELTSRPKSMAMNTSAQQPMAPSYKAHPVGVQNVPNASKPRVVSMHPPAPQSTQPRKSMPELQAGVKGKGVPVYAHASQMHAVPQGPPVIPQGLPLQGHHLQGFSPAITMGPAQIHGVPPFPHQGQPGPVESRHAGPAHHAQFHPTPPIPQQGFTGQIEYRPNAAAHQAQFHPTPPMPQQRFAGHERSGSGGPSYNGPITAQPIPSQARSAHNVPQSVNSTRKTLSVVGPEGVYGAPSKQAPMGKPGPRLPQQCQPATYGSPSLGSFVFELDAGPSESVKPVTSQPSEFIAELPGADISPINWSTHSQPGSLAAPAGVKQSGYDVSPVSPPKQTQAVPATVTAPALGIASDPMPGTAYSPPTDSAVPAPVPEASSFSAANHSSHPVSTFTPPSTSTDSKIVPVSATLGAPIGLSTAPISVVNPVAVPVNLPTPPTDLAREPQYQPVNPIPLEALPASLMIGGPVGQRCSPNNSLSGPSTQPINITGTNNAQKYQRYYSPPSSTSSSTQPSPQPSPQQGPVYKAYSRPISPPPTMATAPNQPHTLPYVHASFSGTESLVPEPLRPNHSNPLLPNLPTPQTPGENHALPQNGQPQPPQNYLTAKETTQQRPEFFNPFTTYQPGHKRSVSHESQASNASHDSSKLAAEYQQELPDFEHGYSSKSSSASSPAVKPTRINTNVNTTANLYEGEGYGRRDSMDFT